MPSYMPVMQYADNRSLREKMYRAYGTRASEFGKADWDNTGLIAEILKAARRRGAAAGLQELRRGCRWPPRWPNRRNRCWIFCDDLAQRRGRMPKRISPSCAAFARSELGIADLQSWDVAYASEKLREQRYAFLRTGSEAVFSRRCGAARHVQAGRDAVWLANQASAPVWHDDVRFFDIRDAQGQLVGQFYLDLYARNSKRGGAWMDDAITRRRKGAASRRRWPT